MKRIKTDIVYFEKRIKYRLNKANAPKRKFALQESVFQDGYFLFYDGREFYSFGKNLLANQLTIQNQLVEYLYSRTYQTKLPF